MPDVVNGYADDVETYDYDPEKAKDLLEEAGADGATIEFNYPTDVSRPYMPSPADTFNVIRSQLEAVGLKIKPTADRWDPDYLNKIQGTDEPRHPPARVDRRLQRPGQLRRCLLRTADAGVGLRQQEALRRPVRGPWDPDA